MDRPSLIVRSFGYGVFLVESVSGSADVGERAAGCGLSGIQEVLPDPERAGRAYVVTDHGMAPCGAELEQLRNYGDDIDAVAEAHSSDRLLERIRWIREAVVGDG